MKQDSPQPKPKPPRKGRTKAPPEFKMRLMDSGDLANLPTVENLIGGHFPRRHLTLLYGPTNAGKSQVAAAIHLSIAWRLAWGEEKMATGLSFYVCLEDTESLKIRHPAWCILNDKPTIQTDGAMWYDGETEKWALPDGLPALIEMIRETCKQRNQPCVAVFVDHVRRALRGANTLGPKQAALISESLETVARSFNCAVFLICHTDKKGEQMAGPAVWQNYADSIYHIDSLGSMVIVDGIKARNAPKQRILFERKSIDVMVDSRLVSSAALKFLAFGGADQTNKAADTAYMIALKMEFGEVLSLRMLTTRLGMGHGSPQNARIAAALPVVGKWQQIKVDDKVKAVRRVGKAELLGLGLTVPPGSPILVQCMPGEDIAPE